MLRGESFFFIVSLSWGDGRSLIYGILWGGSFSSSTAMGTSLKTLGALVDIDYISEPRMGASV